MKTFISTLLNTLFFTIIIVIAISISTIALTKKVNEYRVQNKKDVRATVIKDVIPILSFARGIILKVDVKEGEEVRRGATLLLMDNPLLKGKIEALEEYEDNVSAQTEARVAKEELKNLIISSPTNGIVGDVSVTDGSPVENLSKIMTIYSNDDVRLLAEVTLEQYQIIRQMKEVRAYNERLNQTVVLLPDIVKPEEKKVKATDEKKIGLYLRLKNNADASSLLQNEDVILELTPTENTASRPIDYFVDFWNSLLAKS